MRIPLKIDTSPATLARVAQGVGRPNPGVIQQPVPQRPQSQPQTWADNLMEGMQQRVSSQSTAAMRPRTSLPPGARPGRDGAPPLMPKPQAYVDQYGGGGDGGAVAMPSVHDFLPPGSFGAPKPERPSVSDSLPPGSFGAARPAHPLQSRPSTQSLHDRLPSHPTPSMLNAHLRQRASSFSGPQSTYPPRPEMPPRAATAPLPPPRPMVYAQPPRPTPTPAVPAEVSPLKSFWRSFKSSLHDAMYYSSSRNRSDGYNTGGGDSGGTSNAGAVGY